MNLDLNTIVNQEVFWAIIDTAKNATNGDLGKMSKHIMNDLYKLSIEGVVKFDLIVHGYVALCRGDRLWSIAAAIKEHCTDDSFEDFQYWLIAQGKDIYYAALKNPDVLADLEIRCDPVYGVAEYCDLRYLAEDIYQDMAGVEMNFDSFRTQYLEIKDNLKKTIQYVEDFYQYISPSEFPIKFPKITDKYLEIEEVPMIEEIPELPSAEDLAKEYLTICDDDFCEGDGSVGIPKCPYYDFPDIDLVNKRSFKGGCRLKAALGI